MEEERTKKKPKKLFMNIKSSQGLLTLKNNQSFCSKLISQGNIAFVTDPNETTESRDLVYDFSRTNNFEADAFAAIIDLLMQLRAAGNDQNIFIQNNTVLREQILSQLRNEILKANNKLTHNQIKNLEVISSNSFDEKTLTDILKSLLENSKKKLNDFQVAYGRGQTAKNSLTVTAQNASENYLTILNKASYYEKVLDKVFKNILHEKSTIQIETIKSKAKPDVQESLSLLSLKHKLQKETVNSIVTQNTADSLEQITKLYSENIVKRMGVASKIIKLQSKISEINILTKVGSFVEDVVERSVSRAIESQFNLVNKKADFVKVDEFRESIIATQNQYSREHLTQQRNISRIYSDIRKLYNAKNVSESIVKTLKSTGARGLNIEENVKKNVLKLATRKDVVARFKNVYEQTTDKTDLTRFTQKSELVNRTSETGLAVQENIAIKDVKNLKDITVDVQNRFMREMLTHDVLTKNIHQNNIAISSFKRALEEITTIVGKSKNIANPVSLQITKRSELVNRTSETGTVVQENVNAKDINNIKNTAFDIQNRFIRKVNTRDTINESIRSRRKSLTLFERTLEKTMNITDEGESTKNIFGHMEFINLKRLMSSDYENHLIRHTNIYSQDILNHVFDKRYNKIVQETERNVKKDIILMQEKEITEKFKINKKKQKSDVINRYLLKPMVTTKSVDGSNVEVFSKEEFLRFTPVYIHENILGEDEIENIFSKKLTRVLAPKIMKNKSFNVITKNIYRNSLKNMIDKYMQNLQITKKEYLIDQKTIFDKSSYYTPPRQEYMIYKEEKEYLMGAQGQKSISVKEGNAPEPDVVIKQKIPEPVRIDMAAIEKSIMSKALNQKDVIKLIESYMSAVNIDTISDAVMGKVERKMAVDKRRNGMF